jgi:ribosomal protein S18 acetylase RimI-like enzyme
MNAFQQTMNYVQSKYWETKYPQNYHLVLLATHPDYRRRGAGTALSQWGINQGLAAGIDIGVEASPMGFPLYQHLGFVLQEELVIAPQNDDARLPVKVMVYDKNNKLWKV